MFDGHLYQILLENINHGGLKEDTAYITAMLLDYYAISWCPNHIKIAFFGQMWMLFACFHFLPLLHKRPATPHRQGAQLSWSLPAILQFRSRTLLNPNWAGREKQLFHVFPYCKCEREGQNFPQRSGVTALIFSPHQSIPSALLPCVSSTAARGSWSHRNMAF